MSGPTRDYDRERGLLRRRVFADAAIHRAELETIFARCWLFVGPANWLTRPGDFVASRMGEEPVIAWRGDDDTLRVFVNRCALGGGPITPEARGSAFALRCPCHGVAYRPAGGSDAGTGLDQIHRVDGHRGLVFANRDDAAPTLATWLADIAGHLDVFLAPDGGEVEAHGGDALRWQVDANWKLPALAGCGDPFDDPATHDGMVADDGVQIATRGGVIAVRRDMADAPRGDDDPRRGWRPITALLFPNLGFDHAARSLHVWHPLAPTRTEIHSFCLVPRSLSFEQKEAARRLCQWDGGPAGIRSSHQARLWQAVTAGAALSGGGDRLLNLQMGLGRERPSNLPGTVAPLVSEANQRAFLAWWQEMTAQPALAPRRLMRIRRAAAAP